MKINTKRKYLLTIGIAIISFQTYKYFANQLFNSNLELVVFIIGLAFLLDPTYLLRVFEKVITKKTNSDE
tara:strand:- start:298 stop:507 length:210 start_codon:yes stop_codon:yes gene_type:complete